MRILLVCTALCLAPTTVLASIDVLPTDTAFAYRGRHSTSLLTPDAFTALRPSETALALPALKYTGPDEDAALAPITQDHKLRPVFSRTELCTAAASAAEAHDLPVPFFTNLIQQESGFKPHAVSPAGAQGIAQFMPRVAAAYGLSNPFDPIHALTVSARFLRELFQQFGNLGLAAAAYNAGPGRVGNWLNKKGRLPEETRIYVRNITGRPAEQWVGAKVKAEELKLPPHARCPGLEVMEARAPVPARHGVKVSPPSATKRPVVLAAAAAVKAGAPAAKKAPVIVASAARKTIIIGGERGGKKLIAVATGKKPAPADKPNLRIMTAEKAAPAPRWPRLPSPPSSLSSRTPSPRLRTPSRSRWPPRQRLPSPRRASA